MSTPPPPPLSTLQTYSNACFAGCAKVRSVGACGHRSRGACWLDCQAAKAGCKCGLQWAPTCGADGNVRLRGGWVGGWVLGCVVGGVWVGGVGGGAGDRPHLAEVCHSVLLHRLSAVVRRWQISAQTRAAMDAEGRARLCLAGRPARCCATVPLAWP